MAVLKYWDEDLGQWLPVAPGPKGLKGDKGDQGDQGVVGPTPSLSIGTVTTGTAAATITGTDEEPVLNLTIPPAANDSITSAMIAANAVGPSELADNAVDTAAIATGAVTAPKILIGAATVGSGTGTPEGVVTAAPGSTWLQIGGAVTVSGNLLWRKASGTGNTGWVPEGALADTGWRRILTWTSTDTFSLGTTPDTTTFTYESAGGINIRRVGDTVTVRMDGGNIKMAAGSSSNSSGALLMLPTGFTAGHPQVAGALVGTATFSFYAGSALYRAVNSVLPGPGHYMPAVWSLRFTSDDAWPTSQPGTAA